jgi:plasmid stabilization system protein ParE
MQSEIGRMVPELQNPTIRELIEGNYRIVYQIVDLELIRIIAVTHGAQHFQNKFYL